MCVMCDGVVALHVGLLTGQGVVHVETVELNLLQVQGPVHEYPAIGR